MNNKNFPRKILISTNYGIGWSTSNLNKQKCAEYKPLIDFIENGGELQELLTSNNNINAYHPLIKQINEDLDYPCLIGLKNIDVITVNGPYIIKQHDGAEYILERENVSWWY